MPRAQIRLEDVVTTGIEALRHSMVHCLPGIVHAFKPGAAGQSPATADVQVAIRDPRFDVESGGRLDFDANGSVLGNWGEFPDQAQFKTVKSAQGQTVLQPNNTTLPTERYHDEPWPVLPGVPILYPRGGGCCFQFPLAQGDHVIVLFFDLDPTAHRVYGDERNPVDVRRHGGGYACCIPADICDPTAPQDSAAAGSMLVIGKDGTAQQIRIDGSNVSLGASASDFVALASKVDAELHKIAQAFSSFVPGSGGATFGAPYTSNSPTGSTLVKSG